MLEKGYNKEVPPITSDNRIIIPVQVNINITLLKVVSIVEEDHAIELQFKIAMKWRDNRATYNNLKDKTSLNALRRKDYEQLWLPLVTYDNTDQKETTRLGVAWEWSTFVTIIKEGSFTRSGQWELDETEIFKGEENSLRMQQT